MLSKKKSVYEVLIIFLFAHLIIWTLIPSISNNNLPLDTIEALAWGSNLDWGYIKHPPLSAWSVEVFYKIFGNQDWAYYFLSQLFVVSAFFIVFKFSQEFFKNSVNSLISVFLLEGIYFYNFTTPEFNVNVCQLPFWALTVYYCWKAIKQNKNINWLFFGLFAALGVLSKYLFIYLIVGIKIFFIYVIKKEKKIRLKYFIPGTIFILVFLPHLIWLVENDYITLTYALHRTGFDEPNYINHLFHSFIFLGKQIGILIPFFVMILFVISKFKIQFNMKDKKLLFLLAINIIPIFLMFLTSLFMGIKIRTMWMTPFYLFIGVLFTYILQKKIAPKKLKYFFSVFLVLFIFSPITYFVISITQTDKRTDYPGKKVSQMVQEKWENNFENKIGLVAGDEWYGGNLSYHLKSRPKWDNILIAEKTISLENIEGGFIIIGDKNNLSTICSGIFLEVETQGVCMIGKKK
tara:strand:+ start:141 stop:1526 length:1386 start_codon:yes stop_codon:yes gene_type:complete